MRDRRRGLLCWSLVLIVLATAPGAIDRWGLPIGLGMLPVCAGCLVITYLPRLLRWMTPTTMFANLLAGVLGVFCYHEVFGPELATLSEKVASGDDLAEREIGSDAERRLPWPQAEDGEGEERHDHRGDT